jgi:hypothetical protein
MPMAKWLINAGRERQGEKKRGRICRGREEISRYIYTIINKKG